MEPDQPPQELPQVWLAVSLKRGNGRGLFTDDDFEIVKQEPEIVFSQLELLRERLILQNNKGILYSNGIAVQESDIEWEENVAEWEMSNTDGEHDTWISRNDDSLSWESLIIEDNVSLFAAKTCYTFSGANNSSTVPLLSANESTLTPTLKKKEDW